MKSSPYRGLLSFIGWAIVIFIIIFEASQLGTIWAVLASVAIILGFLFVKRAAVMCIVAQGKFNSGETQAAFKWFGKAYATGTLNPVKALFYAYLLLRDGQLEKSEKIIDEISKKHKNTLSKNDELNIALNKTLIKWKKGDLKGAIEDAEKLYASGIKNTALYGVLGYWYILDGRVDKALEINEEAYEYNSSDQIITDNLAQNYFLVGNTEKAEEMYKDLLEKNPDFIEPYYNYGIILKSKGDSEGARLHFEKALEQKEKFLSTVTHAQIKKEIENL